jgi:glycosyltransferase involved in cell wall biosynthesis
MSPRPRRPRHVSQAFCVTAGHPRLWFRLLRVHRQIDAIIFFSRQQYAAARDDLRLPPAKLTLLENNFVDTDFFRPMREPAENDRQLCAVGREHRDYPTLIAAVAALPRLRLKLDPGSPASRQADSVARLTLPRNVEICRLPMGRVWQLYAESAVVAVPLYANPVDAGLSTVLEAMAMAKPLIITRGADGTYGGRPIVDGETALLVDIGDVAGWRAALTRLFDDPALRRRLGENARRWVERHAARRDALAIIMSLLKGAAVSDVAPDAAFGGEAGESASAD